MKIPNLSGLVSSQAKVQSPKIARMIDMPLITCPPIQFTYTQQAVLAFGVFPFLAATRTIMGNTANITDNTMIYVTHMTMVADIPEQDYTEALQLAAGTTDIPRFSMFLASNAYAPLLRNPVFVQHYTENLPFPMLFKCRQAPNTIVGNITGTLQQTAALAGLNQVNIFVEVYGHEIMDDGFMAALEKRWGE